MNQLESEIKRRIMVAIGAEPDLLLMENVVGSALYINKETGIEYHVPYGLMKGSPDLVGIMLPGGWWVCFEVKQPGLDAEPHQREIHDLWGKFGALVYVVHSPEEAVDALNDARKRRRGGIQSDGEIVL